MALLALPMVGCSSGDLVVGRRDAATSDGGAGSGPADPMVNAARRAASIPIGIENVNNSRMSDANYRALLRFVPDSTIAIERLYFGFKIQGASCRDPGAAGDGGGDGGLLDAHLVNIDAESGLPTTTIAEERTSACARHDEAAAEVGGVPVFVWMAATATLDAGTMYGLIVTNGAEEPEENFFSFHMPIADSALSGPQARNELDPTVSGAIMGLDPREHVAWSIDGGVSWQYGSENGEYRSYMNDDDTAHPATRIPQYGFRLSDGRMLSPQPYYAYKTDCSGCTVAHHAVRYARSFSELGGFTASGDDVGTLTIENRSSGAQASCTPPPGYGFRTCMLAEPVSIAAGEEYSITSTGTVELMELDHSQRVLFPDVGTETSELGAYQPEPAPGTDARDVPSLWAGPLSANFPAVADE